MSVLIDFFSFLWRVLRRTLGFIISMPGMIATSLASLYASVQVMVTTIQTNAQSIYDFCSTAKEHVISFREWISGLSYFPFFSHIFAFDTLATVVSSIVSFFFGLFGLVFVMSVVWLFIVFVPFWIYKLVCKIVQLLSAGFAEPA